MFDNNYICQPKGIPLVSFYTDFKVNENNKIFTPLHYHSDFEILYIKNGKAKMIIDEKEFFANDNSIIFINPFETHYGEILSDNFSYYCIDFDIKLLSLKQENEILKSKLKYKNFMEEKIYEEYIKNIFEAYKNEKDGWELFAKGNLFILFSLIENNIIRSESQKNIFAKNVIEYIENHFNEAISSKNAAEALGYNQSYFCRTFKKTFQMSFCDYLNLYRINKAKEFLKTETVSSASIMSGYSNFSYFTVMFKKITGITPLKFKNHLA